MGDILSVVVAVPAVLIVPSVVVAVPVVLIALSVVVAVPVVLTVLSVVVVAVPTVRGTDYGTVSRCSRTSSSFCIQWCSQVNTYLTRNIGNYGNNVAISKVVPLNFHKSPHP